MASMLEASLIRDVARRHAYVFDNGLASPDFFDVEKRMASEEFALLRKHIQPEHSVYEIGCLTGLNLIGLGSLGCKQLEGIDFVEGAINWLRVKGGDMSLVVRTECGTFPGESWPVVDRTICFDVLEHQLDVGYFLECVGNTLAPRGRNSDEGGQALFLVPVGRAYYDVGHVAFFPDEECLRNVLDYHFEVESIRRLETCEKMFAVCRRRD